jgi:aminodeoxyfutalosine deaminase
MRNCMRKILAHYLFDGFTLRKNAMLVLNEQSQVLDIVDLPEHFSEEAGVEFYNGIICPGFINAHCHLELSHLHNEIPQQSGLPDFISNVVAARKRIPFSLDACAHANTMMEEQGIVAVGDISNSTHTFDLKAQSKIEYHTFIELFDLQGESTDEYVRGKQLFKQYPKKNRASLSPHAPYSCSRKLLAKIAEHAREYEYPVSIHNQEHTSENQMFANHSGALYFAMEHARGAALSIQKAQSSLQFTLPYFEQVQHMLFIHNIYMSLADMQFIKQHRNADSYTLVLCPKSNLYIENTLPPIDLFLKHHMPIAFGTDSLASNSSLCILDELYCAQQAFPEISLEQLLHAATYRGARALQMHTKKGQFKQGTMPGVILLEQLDLHQRKITPQTKVRVLA